MKYFLIFSIVLLFSNISFAKEKRHFKKQLQKQFEFEIERGDFLKWKYYEDNIYILEPTEQKIQVFDSNGRLISSFGSEGRGPGENVNLQNFDVSKDGVFLFDQGISTIRNLNHAGKVCSSTKPSDRFWSAEYLLNGNFMLWCEKKDDVYFKSFNKVTSKIDKTYNLREVLKLDEDQKNISVVYEGAFFRNDLGNVTWVCSKAGLFIMFDPDGSFKYFAKTIDGTPAPKVTTKVLGEFTIYQRERESSFNCSQCMDDSYLYILSMLRFKNAKNPVIDLYNISTGTYVESFEIPNDDDFLAKAILIKGRSIFVLYQNMKVIKYTIQ